MACLQGTSVACDYLVPDASSRWPGDLVTDNGKLTCWSDAGFRRDSPGLNSKEGQEEHEHNVNKNEKEQDDKDHDALGFGVHVAAKDGVKGAPFLSGSVPCHSSAWDKQIVQILTAAGRKQKDGAVQLSEAVDLFIPHSLLWRAVRAAQMNTFFFFFFRIQQIIPEHSIPSLQQVICSLIEAA